MRTVPFVALGLSGMAGLVYEVVWSRATATLFGSVVTATGTLLALFMGGLALGSALGGGWAARVRRPLAAFGLVEMIAGVCALCSPLLLRGAAPLVVRLDVRLPDAVAFLVPAALSALVLGPIVVVLGTTFPLFLAHATQSRDHFGATASWVYGVNTLGAVVGTLAGGFVLLPWLGIQHSLWAAAAIDIAVGIVCILIGLRLASKTVATPRNEESLLPKTTDQERLAVLVALLAGAASLVLEVAWFRALMLVFGSSVYALSLMLAAFLLGLGGGAIVLARRGDRAPDVRGQLGQYYVLIAFLATMVTVVLQILPALFIPLLSISHGSFTTIAIGTGLIVVGFLVAPTVLMGAALPLAIRLAGEDRASGSQTSAAGHVYAASSLGSCSGALLAGFVLVPNLGLRGSVCVAVALSLAGGLIAVVGASTVKLRRGAIQAAALTALLWVVWLGGVFPWNWRILTAGYYAYAHLYSHHKPLADGPVRRTVEIKEPFAFATFASEPATEVRPSTGSVDDERLLSWEEGRFAQVAVVEQRGVRSLLINGKADASNGSGDMRTQLLLGHLPVLLAPDEPGGTALVIGLGSGVTAGAMASWHVGPITVAEIEPAVVRASDWFVAENRNVLADPRVVLRQDDARRVLARSTQSLRVLTSEPSNLWMSGVSLLFTREFFAQAAGRLGERGVLCQWLHLYQVGPDDVKTLLRTVIASFPHLIAFADGTDLLLVGSRCSLELDPVVWQRRLANNPVACQALARVGIRAGVDIARGIVADEAAIHAWVGVGTQHTDDRPILEFTAARHIASDYSGPILAGLVKAGASLPPIPLGASGWVLGRP